MFDKDNKVNKVEYSNNEFYKIDDILITPSFGIKLSEYQNSKKTEEQNNYQDQITSYNKRKYENNIRKYYNPKIVNLYENGSLIIDNSEYLVKDFYIVFDDSKNIFHLKCVNQNFSNDNIEYNKAVKFKDTTAFINLINSDKVIILNNRIIINDINILNDLVSKWDGSLHNETKETDSIINKKMIRDDVSE